MNVKIEESWKQVLAAEFEKPYFRELTDFVRAEYLSGKRIYPAPADIFNAFNLCPFDQVKVVIIGQDPYHNPGEAHGLCFSVKEGVRLPPSLRNIFKELQDDLGRNPHPSAAPTPAPEVGGRKSDLSCWARQGVLLLNSVLSVPENMAGGHSGKGWEVFTDSVIRELSSRRDGIVYILWGSYAQKKAGFVDPHKNLVLKSVHPSPLSAHNGFFGNRHFTRANEYLSAQGKKAIEW